MSYEEGKQLCRKARKEEYDYLRVNLFNKEIKNLHCICIETSDKCIVFEPQANPFQDTNPILIEMCRSVVTLCNLRVSES